MKKIFLINSLVFSLAGMGTIPASTPAIEPNLETRIIDRENLKIAQSSANEIRVLDTGSEPKQILRFTPISGTKQTATKTRSMELNFFANGQSFPKLNIPKTKTDIEVQVNKVDKNGDIHTELLYTNTDVIPNYDSKPEDLDRMRSELKKIEGFKIKTVTDNRGNVKEKNSNIPENIDPAIRPLVEQTSNSFKEISAPLLTEPVGIGAKWQVINNAKLSGIDITATTTYELIERKNNVITLAFNINLDKNLNSQKINLPSGREVEVISFKGKGRGQIKIDLNKIIPIKYKMLVNYDMKMKGKNNNTSEEIILESKSNGIINFESN